MRNRRHQQGKSRNGLSFDCQATSQVGRQLGFDHWMLLESRGGRATHQALHPLLHAAVHAEQVSWCWPALIGISMYLHPLFMANDPTVISHAGGLDGGIAGVCLPSVLLKGSFRPLMMLTSLIVALPHRPKSQPNASLSTQMRQTGMISVVGLRAMSWT